MPLMKIPKLHCKGMCPSKQIHSQFVEISLFYLSVERDWCYTKKFPDNSRGKVSPDTEPRRILIQPISQGRNTTDLILG